jgi:hypothetical protein
MVNTIYGLNVCCNSRSKGKTRPLHWLATDPITKTRHRGTKTKKKREILQTRGLARSSGLTRSSPLTRTEAKLIQKIPEAGIPNEDLFSRTNPRVEFEKNFRRVAFGFQKTTRSTMQKTVVTIKFQESVKSTVDNPQLHSRQDIRSNRRHSD